MNPNFHFTLYDSRHGDTFVIEIEDGEFVSALRYTIGIGRDPIQYNDLADLPEPYQTQIENEISKRCLTSPLQL